MIFIIMNLNEQISRIKKIIYEQNNTEFISQNELDSVAGKRIELFTLNSDFIGNISLITFDQGKKLDSDINRLYSNKDWCIKNCDDNFFNNDNSLFLHSLWVTDKHKRQGHAEKLMNHCGDLAKNNGYKYITLITNKSNIPAQSLYDKLEFDKHIMDDSQIFYFKEI